MFGLSVATELFQGSTERTWNCVAHFVNILWTKFNHIRLPIMPNKSRKRHHSRSRSRSKSPSPDRSHDHEKEDKHKKNDSNEKDRDGKRRKVESLDSPNHKRSVSSEPEKRVKELNDENMEEDAPKAMATIEILSDSEDEIAQADASAEKENKITNDNKKDAKKEGKPSKSVDVVELNDFEEEVTESKEGTPMEKKKNQLLITPKKVLSPKQLQKKMESEKKRQEKQKEKEEKEKKRIEEKEEKERKKNEEKEKIRLEKLKKLEEKQKEKDEKEQKKKERDEREEQKRKEKEQEKIKKQQEIEEKKQKEEEKKQKEEEKKQKAKQAFVKFFVSKKEEKQPDEKINQDQSLNCAFVPFEVKSDMRLPPMRRNPLSIKEKDTLRKYLNQQDDKKSYLVDLKSGKSIGRGFKTWPYEENAEDDEEVAIIENSPDLGQTICEDKSTVQKFRVKFLKFHENRRPPYFGTWRKRSKCVKARKPLAEDTVTFNYEEDSDEDWEEEEQGESLSDDEADKENEEKDDYEVDNDFFVPHGHLSDDEVQDEETSRLSPESLKQKLKLLKDEFDLDMQSKTHKLKPRSIGCIWFNRDGSNVDGAIKDYLRPLAMITKGRVQIRKRSEIMAEMESAKKERQVKELSPECIPMLLKIVHGSSAKKRVLVDKFLAHVANNGLSVDVSKTTILKNITQLASFGKCKRSGPMLNKFCWDVSDEVQKKYGVQLNGPNILDAPIQSGPAPAKRRVQLTLFNVLQSNKKTT